MNGKAVIISAPSGAGKTTIVKYLLAHIPGLEFSVSATSRPVRNGEMDGVDYFFISEESFRNDIEKDLFVEWQEVYPGSFYGTQKKEVERIWNAGKTVIFEVDVVGGMNLKKFFNGSALSVFIRPPDPADLEKRLRNRGTETEESIRKRIGKAMWELGFSDQFDCVIVNDKLDRACEEARNAVEDFLRK